ncbi:MAG: molybdopterin-dependent oxidoreductase [Bacillota bacterium]
MNVKDMASKGLPDTQIIIAVPNEWLQLPITDMLSLQKERFIRVKSLSELYEKVGNLKQLPSIIVIDLLSFTDRHRDIIANLKKKNPSISLIVLASSDKLPYMHYVDCSTSCYIVVKEEMDSQLAEAIAMAKKDQHMVAEISSLEKQQKQLPTSNKKEVSYVMNENETVLQKKFGRRSFLKGSAAAAVAAGVAVSSTEKTVMKALAANSNAESATEKEEIFAGVCRGNCFGGCSLNVHVRNNRVVMTSAREMPDPAYTRICVKGLTHMHRIYHPNRLKYPMRRVGERGEDKWERISWDVAIKEICTKWKQYNEEAGDASGFALYGGSGNYGLVTGAQCAGSPFTRLVHITGCPSISLTVDIAGVSSRGLAGGSGFMGGNNGHNDIKNAKYLFVWGANPVVSQIHVTQFLLKAQEAGTKLIVIDPQYNILAQRADMFVPVRAGTDAALAMCMINLILENGWADIEFLKQHTSCGFLVNPETGLFLRLSDVDKNLDASVDNTPESNPYLVLDQAGELVSYFSTNNPQLQATVQYKEGLTAKTTLSLLLERTSEWTLEKAAAKTGLPAEQIVELARMYAEGPSMIYKAYGLNHYYNGTSAYMSQATLQIIAGQTGGKGKGYCNAIGSGAGFATTEKLFPPQYKPMFGVSPVQGVAVTCMDQVVEEGKYGYDSGHGVMNMKIKGLYASHVNFLTNGAERKFVHEWLSKLDFFVYSDINMNETARYADILLPSSHWFESEDVFYLYASHPYVLFQDECIKPAYESKPDWEIIKLIAEGLGLGEYYSNMTPKDYIKSNLDTDEARRLGLTYENLKEKKAIEAFQDATNFVYAKNKFFETAEGIGRAHVYLQFPEFTALLHQGQKEKYDLDRERMAYFIEPKECGYDNPLRKKYPYQLFSDHSRFHTHSQWWDVDMLRELDPEPRLKVNPEDAKKIGVKSGDLVKIYNDRGFVVMPAYINGGTPPGMVSAPKGWDVSQFRAGHYSDLSSHETYNYIVNSAFNDVVVAVEKYTGGDK